ncbi:uncharacterized protein P884DRAFT_99179 [Thermothelomyces heterothallicus CBS 202.75]|uniref:uncharacterized protein n=1 Tax=Thermothelomyces heterothallicus CBS 202.75 TaxID=1149848 RepID=UPI0037427949
MSDCMQEGAALPENKPISRTAVSTLGTVTTFPSGCWLPARCTLTFKLHHPLPLLALLRRHAAADTNANPDAPSRQPGEAQRRRDKSLLTPSSFLHYLTSRLPRTGRPGKDYTRSSNTGSLLLIGGKVGAKQNQRWFLWDAPFGIGRKQEALSPGLRAEAVRCGRKSAGFGSLPVWLPEGCCYPLAASRAFTGFFTDDVPKQPY